MSSGGGGAPVNPTRCKEKPWDLWVSEIGSDEPRPDEPKETPSRRRPGISLLRHATMSLHGQFPQTDNLNAVVCHMCGATVKCSGAYRHLVAYHSTAAEPALPPPPAPTVKLKSSHSRSKHKKEPLPPPPPPEIQLPVEPVLRAPLPSNIYYAEEQPKSITMPLPVTATVPAGEVQVCVDGDLPVVSIQDTDDLPLGENLTDEIFDIMNSEGIQSAEDPDSTAAWKNIIRDISTLQEQISFQQSDGTEYTGDATLPVYTLSDDLSEVQFATLPPQPGPLPTVLDAVALNPAPLTPAKSRSKASKSKYNFREYDPNKHCGVIAAETLKPCTRSLTCKAHTLSLRRTVEGRSKAFDALLAEHKAAREASAAAALAPPLPPLPPPPAPAPITLSIPPALLVNTSIDLSSFNSLASDQQVTDIYTSLLGTEEHAVLPDTSSITSLLSQALPPDQFLLSEVPELGGEVPILSIASPVEVTPPAVASPVVKREEGLPAPVPSEVCWYSAAPRPLALCTYNASNMGGAVVLGRKFSMVRGNIKSSLSRSQGKVQSGSNSYYNFSQNSTTSLSKTVHLNNASKCSKPEVRRLVVCRGESAESEYARHNGHVGASKRGADALEQCDAKRSHAALLRNSMRVAKHGSHSSDLLELSFMLDPLVTEDKC